MSSTYFSAFVSAVHSAWPDNVFDPVLSKVVQQLIAPAQLNILFQKQEQFELDAAASRSITMANYVNTEWLFLVYRVIGKAYLSLAGVDTDNTTAITSKFPAYGTELLPGIGIVSTYNINTLSVVSQQDDTTIELYAAIACADDDIRLA